MGCRSRRARSHRFAAFRVLWSPAIHEQRWIEISISFAILFLARAPQCCARKNGLGEPAVTDNERVASILQGNVRAFETLLRQHQRMLLRAARAILRDDAEAEDAVQEACLAAYRALGSFRGESKLSTWLVQITVNEALMRRRRLARSSSAMPIDPYADGAQNAELAPGPEGDAAEMELRHSIDERVELLPEEYREVFRLRALEEASVAETAAALGIPEATVRTRYFRARRLLRESLGRDFGGGELPPIAITSEDLERLSVLKPHAALLRELERASVVSRKAAMLAEAITMNSQVVYTDETTGMRRQVNIVFPHQVGGCSCSVSILTEVGSALIGLSPGQAIDWHFTDGLQHRLRVDRVIHRDCPFRAAERPG
jgi:RNA polymerase sigma-70 factor (ECF subfamily)